ncbi:MAG TPA: spondin domain-containing protein [Candidatus Krumholzibacteria bacterium]|nr:spondin domain-containing protein [Candidatus Krumholzibacteria bacterium]
MLHRTRAFLLITALTVLAAAPALALDSFQVTVTNDFTGGLDTGQPFSPPVVVVHDAGFSLFAPGAMASPGLITVAEEGNPATLAGEAMASADVSHVTVGTGPFFGSQTVMIEGNPGDLVSMAWMLGRTNDLFSGAHDVMLPVSGFIEFETMVWDAGSEVNTGLAADLGFYGNPMTGPDEMNPIAAVTSYAVQDDPMFGMLSWTFPPSAHVRITHMGSVPAERASWSEVKTLFR